MYPMMLLGWLVAWVATRGLCQQPAVLEPQDFCEGEIFRAVCQQDEVIVINSALYGRMRIGRCLNADVGVGCRMDVLGLFDSWCSGRHDCEVRVTSIIDSIAEHNRPCSKDYRSYLEVTYQCFKVISKPRDVCITGQEAAVTQPSGYLASVIADETMCGSLDTPWEIKVGIGQNLEIELYDFSASATRRDPTTCLVYATIKDTVPGSRGPTGQSDTICGGRGRRAIVYSSVSNVLEIRLVTKRSGEDNLFFLLKYTAKGCVEPVAPRHGWMKRDGDRASFGCKGYPEIWNRTCAKNVWTGHDVNCSHAGNGPPHAPIIGVFTGSQWASIVIILAIAVTLGLVIFLAGIVILRRKRHLRERRGGSVRDRPSAPELYTSQQYRDLSSAYGTKPLSAMDCSGSENDYYRTWQLQRHQPGGSSRSAGAHGEDPTTVHPAGMVCTNPRCVSQRPYDSMDADRRLPMEHIYESPKFERRDISPHSPPQNQTSNSTTGSSTQYFELDPDQV